MMYDVAMHRTQILLEDWQYEKLQERARREGRAMGELVREAVTGYFTQPAGEEDSILSIIGLGRGDGSGAGRAHDEHLYPPRKSAVAPRPRKAVGTNLRRHERLVR